MIPNTQPLYDHEYRDVIAWSDDGIPLVVSELSGHLTPATSPLTENWKKITQITPAPGWWITDTDTDTDGSRSPVAAWGLNACGELVPLALDDDGVPDDARNRETFVRIEHERAHKDENGDQR